MLTKISALFLPAVTETKGRLEIKAGIRSTFNAVFEAYSAALNSDQQLADAN